MKVSMEAKGDGREVHSSHRTSGDVCSIDNHESGCESIQAVGKEEKESAVFLPLARLVRDKSHVICHPTVFHRKNLLFPAPEIVLDQGIEEGDAGPRVRGGRNSQAVPKLHLFPQEIRVHRRKVAGEVAELPGLKNPPSFRSRLDPPLVEESGLRRFVLRKDPVLFEGCHPQGRGLAESVRVEVNDIRVVRVLKSCHAMVAVAVLRLDPSDFPLPPPVVDAEEAWRVLVVRERQATLHALPQIEHQGVVHNDHVPLRDRKVVQHARSPASVVKSPHVLKLVLAVQTTDVKLAADQIVRDEEALLCLGASLRVRRKIVEEGVILRWPRPPRDVEAHGFKL
mmetsp:Transcript_6026/g.18050  ORF Transcript_6026/g.18050 Transcript_6026/m.18050 type:complete len:339 (-) Transcript_6026:645-1661(-)